MSTMILTAETIEKDLLAFFTQEVLTGDEEVRITETTPLFDGLLDSLGTLRLVVHLEETYQLTVADGELVPDNFHSPRSIAHYVLGKLAE